MRVYLDNAATTPMAAEVAEAMQPFMLSHFGNPSSTHFYGRETKGAIETARRNIAKHLNCAPGEIIFTSGGTEADNMAIETAISSLNVTHLISSEIEHHAVLHSIEAHRDKGVKISFVKLDEKGHVDIPHLIELLSIPQEGKTMVSLMHANNEIATLLPLDVISKICKEHNAYFHSDTVQTMGHYPLDLTALEIDFITGAAHKFHGPKGVGFLYANKKIKPNSLIHGGSQERGLRGGTENLIGIVGMSKALELAYTDLVSHRNHIQGLKTHMKKTLIAKLKDVYFHGDSDPETSLYTVLNVSLPATSKSDMLLFTLDLKGVACSGGSACTSGANQGSHVLRGINADTNRPNARFSFSRYTTIEEIDFAVEQLDSVYKAALV